MNKNIVDLVNDQSYAAMLVQHPGFMRVARSVQVAPLKWEEILQLTGECPGAGVFTCAVSYGIWFKRQPWQVPDVAFREMTQSEHRLLIIRFLQEGDC